jgi:preprotein translocase subunit SecA
VFSWLGLTVAAVTDEDRRGGGTAARREKFAADITYVTGQELAFTWMFDNSSHCRKPNEQARHRRVAGA